MPTTSVSRLARHLPSELCLVVALAIFSVPFLLTTQAAPDEFTTLYNGVRQVSGQVIYRDFFEFTTPLSHWLAAWTFAITGPSLLAARAVQATMLILAGWQAYQIARHLGLGPWAATLPGLLLVCGFFRMFPGFSHHWVVMPFLLGAVHAAFLGLDGSRWWWASAGACTGLAFLTMQSDGVVLFAALAGWIALLPVLGHGGWRALAWRLAALAVGAALPLAAAGAYFLAHGALQAAWYHVWIWPMAQYKQPGGANDVKYLTDLSGYVTTSTRVWINMPFWYAKVYHVLFLALLPLGAAVYAAAWGLGRLWTRLAHRRHVPAADARFGLIALLAIGFFALMVRGRADLPHVAFYVMPAGIVASLVVQRFRTVLTAPEHGVLRLMPLAALGLFLLTGAFFQAFACVRNPEVWLRPEGPDRAMAKAPIFRFLRENTGPEDRLISLPSGGIHYFYGRHAASRYTLILPPDQGYNSEREYREVWREIAERRPKYLLASPFGPWVAELDALRGYRRLPQTMTSPGGWETIVYERLRAGD